MYILYISLSLSLSLSLYIYIYTYIYIYIYNTQHFKTRNNVGMTIRSELPQHDPDPSHACLL